MGTNKVYIDDSKWERIKRSLKAAERAFVRVGFFGEAADGKVDDSDFTMLELAAVHEFGSEDGTIPERSFIRASLQQAYDDGEMQKVCASLYKRIAEGELNTDQALKILGEWAVTIIKKFVTEGPYIEPELKPGTIAAKGSDRPLVDTGAMINAVQYEITGAEE